MRQNLEARLACLLAELLLRARVGMRVCTDARARMRVRVCTGARVRAGMDHASPGPCVCRCARTEARRCVRVSSGLVSCKECYTPHVPMRSAHPYTHCAAHEHTCARSTHATPPPSIRARPHLEPAPVPRELLGDPRAQPRQRGDGEGVAACVVERSLHQRPRGVQRQPRQRARATQSAACARTRACVRELWRGCVRGGMPAC